MSIAVVHSPAEWTARFSPSGRLTAATIGSFDGLHLGHQKIIRAVVEQARAENYVALAVTFQPHPLKVLRPAEAPPMISTLEQRLAWMDALGLDCVLVLRFDLALSQLSPEEFVRSVLMERLGVAHLLVGENFRFGHKQMGNVKLLRRLGHECGFAVGVIPPVKLRGRIVSSTAIRQAVATGEMKLAGQMLGRPFELTGPVQPGTGRGRAILFPTLNLAPEQELLPARAVYATQTAVGGELYRSATNVGVRPTFNGTELTVETHVLGFSGQLAEPRIAVRFRKRLREERKFSGPAALRKQIASDLEQVKKFFARLEPGTRGLTGRKNASRQHKPASRSARTLRKR